MALSQYSKILSSDITSIQSSVNTLDTTTVKTSGDQNISGAKTFTDAIILKNGSTDVTGTVFKQITGGMANNDNWWIGVGATANDDGFMEIATNDNGVEPIYVRQYNGSSNTLKNSLTLLDSSGNTTIPGSLYFSNASKQNIVDTTSAQDVNGTKRFSALTIKKNVTMGTVPSETTYSAIHWTDSTNGTGADHRLATIEYSIRADGSAGMIIGPYQYIANKTSYTGNLLSINITSAGVCNSSFNGTVSIPTLNCTSQCNIPGGRIWIA